MRAAHATMTRSTGSAALDQRWRLGLRGRPWRPAQRARSNATRGSNHAALLHLGVLFELGGEIDRVADDGELEPIVVPDDAVHDIAVGYRDGDAERWRAARARAPRPIRRWP